MTLLPTCRRYLAATLVAFAAMILPAAGQDGGPTREQELTVRQTAAAYFTAKDSGDYQLAYGFLAPMVQEQRPLPAFTSDADKFKALAGAVRQRKLLTVNFLKDPPQAPPGIYAAVDFTGRFDNIDRYCGYLVFFQLPSGRFALLREEENFMDHATEQDLVAKKQDVEAAWAQIARYCP